LAAVSRNRVRPGSDVTAHLIDSEFREMPGMRLTPAQIRRLWNLSQPECDEALERLQQAGALVVDETGRYARRRDD
jgi:DNA-binding GntR family transcriptional regulator